MTTLLLAKDVVENKIPQFRDHCQHLALSGLKPKMCVILVGQNPASLVYIRNKRLLCERIGADFQLVELSENVARDVFLKEVQKMNDDDSVTGCFVQLPISKHLQDIDVTNLIVPEKDIDGLNGNNVVNLYKNSSDGFIPCTPKGILTLMDYYKIPIASKHVVIIGRSLIVGKPLSLILTNKNATVTLCHSKTSDITYFTKQADIIISAVGKSKFLDSHFINENKKQILIDVGMNQDDHGKVCGDINFEDVKDKISAITPVPGGVGPMTVFSLIDNLLKATENILKSRKSK